MGFPSQDGAQKPWSLALHPAHAGHQVIAARFTWVQHHPIAQWLKWPQRSPKSCSKNISKTLWTSPVAAQQCQGGPSVLCFDLWCGIIESYRERERKTKSISQIAKQWWNNDGFFLHESWMHLNGMYSNFVHCRHCRGKSETKPALKRWRAVRNPRVFSNTFQRGMNIIECPYHMPIISLSSLKIAYVFWMSNGLVCSNHLP